MLVAQLCPTLCDTMDCSPPGSTDHGILQARTLEWAAVSFSTDINFLKKFGVDQTSHVGASQAVLVVLNPPMQET